MKQILMQIQEWSFLPEAKHLTTQQLPTHFQQEDTDFARYFGKPLLVPLLPK